MSPSADSYPDYIGRNRILGLLVEGSMGRVYRAEQTLGLASADRARLQQAQKAAAEKKDDKKESTPAPSGPVTLAWKFEKDKPFYQEMTTETKQTMTVMNQPVPTCLK